MTAAAATPFSLPVRAGSRPMGGFENTYFRPITSDDRWLYLRAAETYDERKRDSGKRCGPIGQIGLEVLRVLLKVIDYKSGRLEPSIRYLMEQTRRSRDAVVRGLAKLKASGFLEWDRRYGPTGNRPGEGPLVKQETNAYRLSLPAAARRLLGKNTPRPPLPDDEAQRVAEREAQPALMVAALPQGMRAREQLGQKSKLANVLDAFGALFDTPSTVFECESAIQTATTPINLKKT